VGAPFSTEFQTPPNSMVLFKEDHEKEVLDLGPYLRNRGPTADNKTGTAVEDFIKQNAMPLIYDVGKGLLALPPGILKKHSTYIFMFGVTIEMPLYELARTFKNRIQFVSIPVGGPKKIMDFFQVSGKEHTFPLVILTVGHHARLNLDVVTDGVVSAKALNMLIEAYTHGGFGTLRMFIEDQTTMVGPVDDMQTITTLQDFESVRSSTANRANGVWVVFFSPEDLPNAERQMFNNAVTASHLHGNFAVAIGEPISASQGVKPYSVVVYRQGAAVDVWDHFAGEDLMDAIVDVDADLEPAKAVGKLTSTVPSTIPLTEFLEVALVPNVIDVSESKLPQGLLQPNRPLLVMFSTRPPAPAMQKLAKTYKQKMQFVRFHKTVRHALGLKLGIPVDRLQTQTLVCIVEMHHPDPEHKIYMLNSVFENLPEGEEINVKVLETELAKFMKGALQPIDLHDFHKMEL